MNEPISNANAKRNFLTTLWAYMALVLSSCLCAGIFTAATHREWIYVNSLDDLVHSNMNVVVANDSHVWHLFNAKFKLNVTLDDRLDKLYKMNRIQLLDDKDWKFRKVCIKCLFTELSNKIVDELTVN